MDPTSINRAEGGERNGSELREKVRQAIVAGKLPNQEPALTFGGHGDGASCVICDEPITPHQIGFDIEFGPDAGGDAGSGPYYLHAPVFHRLAGGVPQHYGEPHGDQNLRGAASCARQARNTWRGAVSVSALPVVTVRRNMAAH